MTELWCCHIEGPDDVFVSANKEDAQKLADKINLEESLRKKADHDPIIKAIVEIWPYSAEAHAAELVNLNP